MMYVPTFDAYDEWESAERVETEWAEWHLTLNHAVNCECCH
jgi:hypothetical protein